VGERGCFELTMNKKLKPLTRSQIFFVKKFDFE